MGLIKVNVTNVFQIVKICLNREDFRKKCRIMRRKEVLM